MKRDCTTVMLERQYSSCGTRIVFVVGATGRRNVYGIHRKSGTDILGDLPHVGFRVYEGIICA
jgi:hypothetical protein